MASLPCTHNLSVTFNTTETVSLGQATQTVSPTFKATLGFGNGTGAGQVDQHWESQPIVLAAGASTTILLSALTDALGRTIPFLHVQTLGILVTTRQAGDYLLVGDPTSSVAHAWTSFLNGATQAFKVWDVFAIGVGGTADGYAVASGSNDQVVIKNAGANSMTFNFIATGRDA